MAEGTRFIAVESFISAYKGFKKAIEPKNQERKPTPRLSFRVTPEMSESEQTDFEWGQSTRKKSSKKFIFF